MEIFQEYDSPHLIMTYTALLSLAILRDDFSQLDREGTIKFVRSCQREDGSFASFPGGGDADLRQVYCAFAISNMLDDWSGMDVERAIGYIQQCSSHEGGYGQQPTGEALAGTTYCALASLFLSPSQFSQSTSISQTERSRTIRWLLKNQTPSGGFCGRTNKEADACYCFWCGASLHMLGVKELVNTFSLTSFLSKCQFKFGGLSKSPGSRPDPYHTYLSLAALSLFPPPGSSVADDTWKMAPLDPYLNATEETVRWVRAHVPKR